MQDDTTYVEKTAKCKRCGSKTVTWQTSKKTGAWYLTEVFTYADGERTSYRDFHSAYCELPERHEAKQTEISMQAQEEKAAQDRVKAERDSAIRRAEHTASETVLGWYSMAADEIRIRIPQVEEELSEEERRLAVETAPANRYTMDDFYEQNKQLARIGAHKARIKFLTAERDVLKARLENES